MSSEPDEDGVYDQAAVQQAAYARCLVIGTYKIGKSTALATTAPKPLIINCDTAYALRGASHYATQMGAEFKAINAFTVRQWRRAQQVATKLVAAGEVQTIIWDTLTLLSKNLSKELASQFQGWERWDQLRNELSDGYDRLATLDAHLFVVAHMSPDYDGVAGILPSVQGKAKEDIPGVIDDWVFMDLVAGRVPHERMFLLGSQEKWTSGGRNIRRTCAIEATVPALLAEMGIPL